MDQERIGKFIKKIREENNLTQKEFADKLGVTPQAVSKWETGKNIPDISILKMMTEEFSIDISEILNGKKKENHFHKGRIIIGIITIILVIIILLLFLKNNNDYEFKTISSNCSDFKMTGSAAYNKEKATIYISNIEFCGKEDLTEYKKISCILYENYKDTKTKISNCKEEKNSTLENYLKEINISVDHYSNNCKNYTTNTLSLEIQATSPDNKIITYIIPIKLNDTCK